MDQARLAQTADIVGSHTIFHFWCPVPVSVRTNEQTYRENIPYIKLSFVADIFQQFSCSADGFVTYREHIVLSTSRPRLQCPLGATQTMEGEERMSNLFSPPSPEAPCVQAMVLYRIHKVKLY